MSVIRATNAVEIVVDHNVYSDSITVTLRRPGAKDSKGETRAYLTVDSAGELAAKLSNLVDSIKRG